MFTGDGWQAVMLVVTTKILVAIKEKQKETEAANLIFVCHCPMLSFLPTHTGLAHCTIRTTSR